MVKIEKTCQTDNDYIVKFLDDLKLLTRRGNPDEKISEGNQIYTLN